MINLDQRFVVPGGSAADLVTAVYGDIRQYYNDAEYINRRILMSPKNDTTDFINEYVINQIPGEGKTLLSADSVPDDQSALYPTEFLNLITPSGLPPHHMYLKIHASVILLRSLDPTGGLCNGTWLTIRALLNRIIDAEIATGVHEGKRVIIPRIPMTPTDTDFLLYFGGGSFPFVLHPV